MGYWLPLVWLKEVLLEIGGWIQTWFEEHKLVRRLLVLWVMGLLTAIAYYTLFLGMEKITEPAAKVIIAYVGLLTIVLAFYQWSRDKEK